MLAAELVRGILGGLPRFFPIAAILLCRPYCSDPIVATLLFPSFCIGTLLPPIRDDDSAFCGMTAAPALTPGGGPGTFRRPVWTALLSVLSCNGSWIGGRGFRPEGAEAASE